MFIYVFGDFIGGGVVCVSLAERLIKEFEENVKLRKRLAELLVSEPEIRLVLINAVIADVATKKDLNELRNELRGEISRVREELKGEIGELRGEISELRREVHSNFRWTVGLIVTFWGVTVIPILLKLIGAI